MVEILALIVNKKSHWGSFINDVTALGNGVKYLVIMNLSYKKLDNLVPKLRDVIIGHHLVKTLQAKH